MSEADRQQVLYFRKLGPAGRLDLAFSMFDFACEILAASVRRRHPDWNQQQVARAVRARLQPAESRS